MRLSKITITGFKSFADTTEFLFDAPIIGIVGPNGCGKSNVVDAVKWVLGERSAKSLRGEAMLDVIFAGSAVRKPLGAAIVTLTFDNPIVNSKTKDPDDRRFLSIDTDEVAVARRLYRDGRSEYLINGNKVRMKDIRELFLDTGIGTNAYSIIEQGRVAAMLQANPTERRGILEEAAGVARFKTRRKEAERKLERTDINLVRVREQLANTERRLRIVRGQAEKARKYTALDSRLKEIRTDVVLDHFHELHSQLLGLTSRLTILENERQQLTQEVIELEDIKRQKEVDRHTLHTDHQSLLQNSTEHESAIRHSNQRCDLIDRSIAESRQQLVEDRSRLNDLKTRQEVIAGQHESAREEIGASAERLADIDREVDRISNEHSTLQQQVVKIQDLLTEIQDEIESCNTEQSRINAVAQSAKERLNSQQENLNRSTLSKTKLEQELFSLHNKRETTLGLLSESKLSVNKHEEVLKSHDKSAHSLGEQAEQLTSDLESMRHQRAASGSRLHLLEEMQHAREGLTDAVKHVLNNPDQFPQVSGILGDAINTQHADANVVEIALGQNVQLLLVNTSDAVLQVEKTLSNVKGRIGLLPTDHDVPNMEVPSGITPLLSLIQVAEHAKNAAAIILSNTAFCSTLEAAFELQRMHPNWRFVTKDGELVESDGRIFVGKSQQSEQNGWLSRKIEISALTIEVSALDQQIEQRQSQLSELLHESEQAKQQQRDASHLVRDARNAVVEHEYQLQRIEDDTHRCSRQLHTLTEELEELEQQISISKSHFGSTQEQADSLLNKINESTKKRDALRENFENALDKSEVAAELLTAARVNLGQIGEKHEANRRELRHIETAQEELTRQKTLLQDQIARRLGQLEQLEGSKQDAIEEIEGRKVAYEKCKLEIDSFNEKVKEADQAVEISATNLQNIRNKGQHLERDAHALELSRREAEINRENLEERTLEELELDVSQEYTSWKSNAEVGDRPTEDRVILEEETETLKNEIKKLGNVNLDAIEEEKTLEERNVDLAQQVIDIDASVKSLTDLISELEELSKTRFEEAFNLIREHFAGSQGMFRKLFGGGSADIMMLPDENGDVDLLEAGIEIKAKPPGKQPRVISQLSGGEQAMTAVALLLSIFKAKPSPFCILDEVDAALDESNTHRFASSLHHFLDNSHFIVITHHKRTMVECDKLYGVTMQERGVSKHVAVTVDEVGNKGEIDSTAQERSTKEVTPIVETRPQNQSSAVLTD
ncbi:MAG: chromosome segregation protein SMC [Phycisphaerales bacterium]|jgi:chromosome segregation protein|nr:chromosome segregation protein SMC [Phycisphaerales bacterium]